ncbi:MAG: HDIG domain-containing protein, partial [Candidatus Hydrogenedentes bacterium]|nr:HDIG domain-containing protein [Candidatus Hydrogenedentota bacterium]
PAEAEGPPPPAPVKALAAPEKTPFEFAHLERLAGLSRSALEYTLAYGILNPNAIAAKGPDDVERSIVVRRDQLVGGQKDTEVLAVADVPVPVTARQALLQEWMIKAVQAQSGAEADTPLDWTQLQDAALAMAKLDVAATLVFDEPGTEGAKEAARNEVPPVMRTIQRDARIQEGGMPWTEQTISDYTAYQAWRQAAQAPVTGLVSTLSAHMVLVALILACLVKSLPLLIGDQSGETRDLTLVLLIMCVTILLGRVALYFDPSGLLVPAAAGAILLAILTNARLAAWASLLTAVLLSIQFGYNWALLVVYSAMAFAGVLSIFVVRRRNDMASAAIKATLVGVLAVVAITLATGSLFSERTFHQVLFVGVNGIICLLAVPALLSPLERLFAITTDIQLLEYSDLNNEVLSRLAIEVPATYAHSLMLGQLAEAAAVSIGANGLLARVCAYYHDIGKLRRPEYFTENQTGANVHDGLSPRLSARAIASHVAEGAEMAREFHLPKPMIDAIYEHHGTCLISFFYQDALAQQKHGDVREADFRYAGPKPQSRETAILMICDAVESGVRSIKNPNEERIRELVDKIVSSRAADRQFDESDLTLKDLDTIKEVVTRRMLTSLHGRVAYPDEFPRNEADNVIPMSGGSEA